MIYKVTAQQSAEYGCFSGEGKLIAREWSFTTASEAVTMAGNLKKFDYYKDVKVTPVSEYGEQQVLCQECGVAFVPESPEANKYCQNCSKQSNTFKAAAFMVKHNFSMPLAGELSQALKTEQQPEPEKSTRLVEEGQINLQALAQRYLDAGWKPAGPEPEAVFTEAISNLNYFPHFNSKYAVYGYVGGQVVSSIGHNSMRKALADVNTFKAECDTVCFYDQRNQEVQVSEWKAVANDGVYTHWKKHSWSFEAAPVSYQCQTFDRVGRLLEEETIKAATLAVCKVKALVWVRRQQQYADVKEYRIIGSDGYYAHKMHYMGRWQQYKQVEFPAGY